MATQQDDPAASSPLANEVNVEEQEPQQEQENIIEEQVPLQDEPTAQEEHHQRRGSGPPPCKALPATPKNGSVTTPSHHELEMPQELVEEFRSVFHFFDSDSSGSISDKETINCRY